MDIRRTPQRVVLWALVAVLPTALAAESADSAIAASANPVGVSAVVLGDLDCVVSPSRVVELGLAVPGLLADTHYDRGDTISAGTVMATLRSEMEEIALAMAQHAADAQTTLALRSTAAALGVRTHRRNQALQGSAAVSEQTLDQLETESEIAALQVRQEEENALLAELERERARADLLRRRVVSPIDGVVTERYHHAGEYIDGEPVYQVAQLDPLHVEVIVPIEYRGALREDMAAGIAISAPGFGNRPVAATVERIDVVADAASATYGVRLSLPNPTGEIPGGVRCTVDFYAGD